MTDLIGSHTGLHSEQGACRVTTRVAPPTR